MTPPPVVELPDDAKLSAAELVREASTWDYTGYAIWADQLRALADSLSEITPERVEQLESAAESRHFLHEHREDFERCPWGSCIEARAALAALSRIASGSGIAGAGKP